MPFAEAWIDLANVIYSEINQKENKVSYNIVYMWNLEKKMVQMNLFAKKKKRLRCREQTYGYQQRKGVDEMGLPYIHCFV